MKEKNLDNIILIVSKFVGKPLLLCMLLAGKQSTLFAQSLDKDGLVARTHGNKGKSPKYALTVQDVQNVKTVFAKLCK